MLRICLLFFIVCLPLQAQSVEEIQKEYIKASDSKENTEKFYTLMESVALNTPVKKAYKGASLMMYSKQSGELRQMLKEGKKLIEEAVKEAPTDIEVHFIRLSVQEHLPKIVPYRSNIVEDKDFILQNLGNESEKMRKYIKGYISKSKVFTQGDKERIGI